MLKRLSLFALAAGFLFLMTAGFADQSKKVIIPVERTNPTDGKLMYTSYCAPCHGTDGRGGGPVASDLKTQPTDLTMLTRNNGGKYPDTHVVAVLHFGASTPAHGTAQMPVWGKVLGSLNKGTHTQEKDLRIANLSRYLQSLQAQ